MVFCFSHGVPAFFLFFFLVKGKREKSCAGSGELLLDGPGVLVLDERKAGCVRCEQKTATPSKQALGDVQNAAHTCRCCQQTLGDQ